MPKLPPKTAANGLELLIDVWAFVLFPVTGATAAEITLLSALPPELSTDDVSAFGDRTTATMARPITPVTMARIPAPASFSIYNAPMKFGRPLCTAPAIALSAADPRSDVTPPDPPEPDPLDELVAPVAAGGFCHAFWNPDNIA